MADKIRRVDYFSFEIDDTPGAGARVLGKLKDAQVNLLSFVAFPIGSQKAQLTVVPAKADAFAAAATGAGLTTSARKECFLVEGEDRVGAAYEVLKRLADANISCTAANANSAAGSYGMVVFVKAVDLGPAAKALGV